MAVVRFSRKEFEKHIKLSKEMEEKINMFGTHIEEITNEEIVLEVLPNRPDLFSLQGFLRAFKAFLGKETGMKKYKVHKPEKDFEVFIDRSVEKIRPYTACGIIKGINFDDAKIKGIIDIQERLHDTIGRNRKKVAIGIYPLDKISLPIKYEARKPKDIKFVPLDFDRELTALQILQQHPTGREYRMLLKDKERFPVFVDAKGEILSMPPIINSEKTGRVTENTRDIFIECSGFDFDVLKKVLNILVTMLADMGGSIYQMELNYWNKKVLTPNLNPEKMKISVENVNRLLGLKLKQAEIKKLLERMGYDVKGMHVLVPAWRIDVLHEVDLIEDIAIAYGYNSFKPELPEIASIGKESAVEVMKRKIAEMLVGLNMLELSTFHLVTKEDLKKIKKKPEIEVEASKTEYSILRPNLLCNILKVLGNNVDASYPQRVFEIGKVFSLSKESETNVEEREHLVIALCPSDFTEVKQVLEYIARMIGFEFEISEITKKEDCESWFSEECFIEGRVAKIVLTNMPNKPIGIIGEIHPSILKDWHIKMPVSLFELDIEFLFRK